MQTLHTIRVGGLFSLLLMTACGSGGGDEDDGGPSVPVTTTNYQVVFTPEQVIGGQPAPDSVTASANLSTAEGEDITANGSVTVNGANPTAVTINAGYAGENGPVAVALTGSGGSWSVPSGTELDFDDLFRLQATGYYVSIQTPDGELRGQILPPGWAAGVIDLDASGVVPETSSTGSARAGFAINPSTGTYRVRMTVTGISDAISAGIRNAIAGARGEVVGALERSTTDMNVWGSRDINNVNADDLLTPTGLDLLASGSLYFSLETVANMDGELRGQIVDDSIDVFDSTLTALEVVTGGPPVVSDAGGVATVTWIEALSRFGVAVNTDISDALSVFVQQGAPGENGTVVFSLTPDLTLPGNWVLPVTELTEDQAAAFEAGDFYASIVTAEYADGELRGQLTESPPGSPLALDVTVDESTRQQTPLDATGGTMSMTTSGGALVTVDVPELTIAESKDFSITEITAISGFPVDAELLAAVRMGPAGEFFSQPVTLTFDVTGMRRPGTVLVGFRTRNDGEQLQLVPVRDALGNLGYYSTSRDGSQVSLDVVGFSNLGIIEMLEEEVPGLLRAFLVQGRDFELPEELLLRVFNLALGSAFDAEDIDELADNMLADLVRHRRTELSEIIAEFIGRPEMTPDDLPDFLEINVATLLTNMLDLSYETPVTSHEELQDSLGLLVSLAEIYGAGLHLQCFVNPEGVEDALGTTALFLLLRVAEDLLAGNPELTFEDISAVADEVSRCFNQTVLDAYFESFDTESDRFSGLATNIVSTVTDNLANTSSTDSVPDVATGVQFIEPRLVSESPLTIEFREVSDLVNGIFMDDAQIVFDAPGDDGERTGRIELLEEESFSVASSPEAQEDGERPIITFNLLTVAQGPILATPTSIDIAYQFESVETNDGLLENVTRNVAGDLAVSKSFTPSSFADEIELYERP